MIFAPKYCKETPIFNYNIELNSHKLTKPNCIKYLGVFMDQGLTWATHIDHVCNKLKACIPLFYKARQIVSSDCLVQIFQSFAYSNISYACEVYGNANETVLNRLHTTCNRLLRVMLKKPLKYKVNELYKQLRVLPVSLLFRFKVVLLAYNCVFNSEALPFYFHNLLTYNSNVHSHSTRSAFELHVFSHTATYEGKCFRHSAPVLWNKLPVSLGTAKSLTEFKRKVKDFYLDNLN